MRGIKPPVNGWQNARFNPCTGHNQEQTIPTVRCIADPAELHNEKQMLSLLLECLNALLLCHHLGGVQHGTRSMVCPSYVLVTGGSIPSRPLFLYNFRIVETYRQQFLQLFLLCCCCCLIVKHSILNEKTTLIPISLA